jgi:hypothetical protein
VTAPPAAGRSGSGTAAYRRHSRPAQAKQTPPAWVPSVKAVLTRRRRQPAPTMGGSRVTGS